MFSSIGLPGLNGFVGEFLTLLGAFASHRWWAVVAAVGVIVAALYLLWAYQRVFHGTPDEANRSMPDLRAREAILLAPLLGLIVFLGVYPKPVLERMEPSVVALIDHVSRNVPDFSEKGPKTDEQLEEEKAEREARTAEGAAENVGGAGGGEHK